MIEPSHHAQHVSSPANRVNIQRRLKSLDPRLVSSITIGVFYILPCTCARSCVIILMIPCTEFIVGMCHRSKKRKPSELTGTDTQSSSSHGITRYNSNISIRSISSTPDPPGSYRQQLGTSQSSPLRYYSSSNFSKNSAGLPSPVPTVATTRSSVSNESKSNKLSQIIHPSHEPTTEISKSQNQIGFATVEDKSASTKRIIEGVCETLHISTDLYYYL